MIIGSSRRVLSLMLKLFFVTCCLPLTILAAPSWEGVMGEENGLLLVDNPENSMTGDQTITPRELWRLGGEEDDQEMIFGLIGDALADDQGNTYLLDTILSTIYKIAPDGTVLNSLGREGDGPGELRNSQDMIFMPDGKIGVTEMMSGHVVVLGLDGTPGSNFLMNSGGNSIMTMLERIATTEQSVIVGQVSTVFAGEKVTTNYTLGRYAPDGTLKNYLFEDKVEQSGGTVSLSTSGDENDFTKHWTLCPDGRIVVFQNDQQYKLEVFDSSGNPTMIIRRTYEPLRRSKEAIEKDKERHESMRKRFGVTMDIQIRKFARHISEAIGRPNGDLWVENGRGDRDCPEHSIGFFDVFNSEGQYIKRVRLEADYDPERDNFCIRNNNLYVFKEAQKAPDRTASSGGGGNMMIMINAGGTDEDDDEEAKPYEVVCYRLPE